MERLFFSGSINFLSGFSGDIATRKEALDSAVKAIEPDTLERASPLLALFKYSVNQKEVGSGLDVKVKCLDCSLVHKVHIRPPKPILLSFLLSEGPESKNVKIDVDGHETSVIEGAKKTIKSRKVSSWAIELNGKKRIEKITDTMIKNGYVIAGDYEHYPGYEPPTIDRIFLKKELLNSWKKFIF